MQHVRQTARVLAALTCMLMVAALPGGLASGQEKTQAEKPKAAAEKPKKPAGRLPAYFGEVVDGQQREAIYKIQQEYEPKLAALRQQLDALTKERDAKVNGVLTPEQRKKVEDLQAAAKKKREEKKPEAKKEK